jgi:plasmid stabilization system protein ParE
LAETFASLRAGEGRTVAGTADHRLDLPSVTLRFAPQAEADFATVIGYLAERNPVAAQKFGERTFALIDSSAARCAHTGADAPSSTVPVIQASNATSRGAKAWGIAVVGDARSRDPDRA